MSAAIPVYARDIAGVGQFVFRRLVPEDKERFGDGYLRLTRGEKMPVDFDAFGTAVAMVKALTVMSPPGWAVDDLDPAVEADVAALARVSLALCAGEEEARVLERAPAIAALLTTSELPPIVRDIRGIGRFTFRHAAPGVKELLVSEYQRQTDGLELPLEWRFLSWAAAVAMALTVSAPPGWCIERLALGTYDDAVRLTQVFVEISAAGALNGPTAVFD